jgi:hypothetical protein
MKTKNEKTDLNELLRNIDGLIGRLNSDQT